MCGEPNHYFHFGVNGEERIQRAGGGFKQPF